MAVKTTPTKTNLLKLRRDLGFAREGYELLEQKRQILVVELMGIMDKTAEAQKKTESALAEAYEALRECLLVMGHTAVSRTADAVRLDTDIQIHMRRVMGVNLPQVQLTVHDRSPYYSIIDTSFWVDESIRRFKNLLEDLASWAEYKVSLMRLAEEVRKTMRRVNALEKIAMPDYRTAIRSIEASLEENEREMFATLKLIKERLQKKKG
ncbi:MAG TPA: V-type ATP synthase subunit D [bacterium]|nr:V-type ATP synthase subunit D [bacterium]